MPEPESKPAATPAGELRACGPTETQPFDDMHDNQQDWDRYASALPLRWCCTISDAFDAADKQAVHYQTRHRWITCIAAFVATFAVVLAIGGLGYGMANGLRPGDESASSLLNWIERAELVAAFATLALVLVGFTLRYKDNWLRFRHRAELYRLLRYKFLIQPSVWRNAENPESWIQTRISEIDGLTGEKGLEKALNEPSPPGPYEPTVSTMNREGVQALTQYYLSKRLGPQKEYFANRAQRNEIKDWMRILLPFFFFGSIVAVAAKLAFNVAGQHWVAFGFVMAAILLPVFAAGIRTYLAAFEFSRNKSRFYAAHRALAETEKSLVQNTFVAVTAEPRQHMRQESVLIGSHLGQVIVVADSAAAGSPPGEGDTNAYPVLRDLAWCEHLLDAEHREWLRLMYDAEWFG